MIPPQHGGEGKPRLLSPDEIFVDAESEPVDEEWVNRCQQELDEWNATITRPHADSPSTRGDPPCGQPGKTS